MLRTALIIIGYIALVGILTAEFEMLGMRSYLYLGRVIAALGVAIAAYTHTGLRLCIIVGCFGIFLLIRRDWQRKKYRT